MRITRGEVFVLAVSFAILGAGPRALAEACTTDADCAAGDWCTIGLCISGFCQYGDAPDGTACDDGDPCTEDDACTAGVCAGTPIPGCGACTTDADCVAGDGCTIGLCISGFCQYDDAPDGTACDDGDPCTEDDACTAGVCAGTPIPGCGACTTDADCDDGDDCTFDWCVEGVCEHMTDDREECQGSGDRPAIPTVSEWGQVMTALLVLTAGTVILRQRRETCA